MNGGRGKGWSAKGLLLPLWNDYDGGREGLAKAVGTQPTVLSSINTGKRNLGHDLARRLASELNVSVLLLGAPEDLADDQGLTLLRRLEALEEHAAGARVVLQGLLTALAEHGIRVPLPREATESVATHPETNGGN